MPTPPSAAAIPSGTTLYMPPAGTTAKPLTRNTDSKVSHTCSGLIGRADTTVTLPSTRGSTMKLRPVIRSEEHTSELQSLMRISYAVFCLKKKRKIYIHRDHSRHCIMIHQKDTKQKTKQHDH